MIEIGLGCLLLAMALLVLCCIDPTMKLLDAVKHHRQAQGDSVMKHAGLFDLEDEEADA